MRRRRPRSGFTIIELLVVIAIIGVLVALLLPAVQAAREAARRTKCANNLKQLGVALLNYHDTRQSFPMGYVAGGPFVDASTDVGPGWAWGAMILPEIEQGPLFDSANFWLDVSDPANSTMARTTVASFLCPSDVPPTGPFWTLDASKNKLAQVVPSSYSACVGGVETAADFGFDGMGNGKGVFFRNSSIGIAEITDGTSSTALLLERCWGKAQGTWVGVVPTAVIQPGPRNTATTPPVADVSAPTLVESHSHYVNFDIDEDSGMDDVSSLHPGGVFLLFADGSVRFQKSAAPTGWNGADLNPALRRMTAIGTRSGKEIVTSD